MINKINIDQTHQLAITNFNTGKREEAERLFREVLKTNPSLLRRRFAILFANIAQGTR